ncbi:MAG: phage holin family protein [Clostridia bacterium]
MINLKVRMKNPIFWVQIILAILTPILAYMGITAQDLTTWAKLGQVLLQAIQNPYVLSLVVISTWNAVNDPTSSGVTDSLNALTYNKPNNVK